MTLKIIREKPPNYDAIVAVFPAGAKPGTFFCYGRAVYIPNGGNLSPSLMAHETVHADRQTAYPGGPAAWWERYLVDPQFRFDEELPAHVAEYRCFDGDTRNQRRFMLRQIAARLSGPLYGRLVTMHQAKRLITGRENPDG